MKITFCRNPSLCWSFIGPWFISEHHSQTKHLQDSLEHQTTTITWLQSNRGGSEWTGMQRLSHLVASFKFLFVVWKQLQTRNYKDVEKTTVSAENLQKVWRLKPLMKTIIEKRPTWGNKSSGKLNHFLIDLFKITRFCSS